MALTIANPTDTRGNDVFGVHRVAIKKVTFDSSYATGGESFAPADVGMAHFDAVLAVPDSNALGGYVIQYDHTAKKLRSYEEEAVAAGGPLVETPNGTDLSTLVVRVICIGS